MPVALGLGLCVTACVLAALAVSARPVHVAREQSVLAGRVEHLRHGSASAARRGRAVLFEADSDIDTDTDTDVDSAMHVARANVDAAVDAETGVGGTSETQLRALLLADAQWNTIAFDALKTVPVGPTPYVALVRRALALLPETAADAAAISDSQIRLKIIEITGYTKFDGNDLSPAEQRAVDLARAYGIPEAGSVARPAQAAAANAVANANANAAAAPAPAAAAGGGALSDGLRLAVKTVFKLVRDSASVALEVEFQNIKLEEEGEKANPKRNVHELGTAYGANAVGLAPFQFTADVVNTGKTQENDLELRFAPIADWKGIDKSLYLARKMIASLGGLDKGIALGKAIEKINAAAADAANTATAVATPAGAAAVAPGFHPFQLTDLTKPDPKATVAGGAKDAKDAKEKDKVAVKPKQWTISGAVDDVPGVQLSADLPLDIFTNDDWWKRAFALDGRDDDGFDYRLYKACRQAADNLIAHSQLHATNPLVKAFITFMFYQSTAAFSGADTVTSAQGYDGTSRKNFYKLLIKANVPAVLELLPKSVANHIKEKAKHAAFNTHALKAIHTGYSVAKVAETSANSDRRGSYPLRDDAFKAALASYFDSKMVDHGKAHIGDVDVLQPFLKPRRQRQRELAADKARREAAKAVNAAKAANAAANGGSGAGAVGGGKPAAGTGTAAAPAAAAVVADVRSARVRVMVVGEFRFGGIDAVLGRMYQRFGDKGVIAAYGQVLAKPPVERSTADTDLYGDAVVAALNTGLQAKERKDLSFIAYTALRKLLKDAAATQLLETAKPVADGTNSDAKDKQK